jgi:hypothetical protein
LEARGGIELPNKGFAVLYLRRSKALASTTWILPCPDYFAGFPPAQRAIEDTL